MNYIIKDYLKQHHEASVYNVLTKMDALALRRYMTELHGVLSLQTEKMKQDNNIFN